MQLNPSEISELLKSRIQQLGVDLEVRTQGTVVTVTDGICRIHGLSDAMQGEILEFKDNTFGLALNLERDSVGSVILGDYEHISEGDVVKTTGRILDVPVGPELLGRVVNSLGQPIDGKGPVNAQARDVIGPLSSSGRPSGFTTRPISSGPTGTDIIVFVRFTTSPSFNSDDSPSSTAPTSSSSRFSANPKTLCGNASISPAITFSSP